MAGSLGSLVIELAANTARLQSDMGKAVNVVQGAVGKMNNILKGIGVGVGIATFVELAKHSIELGDNLNKAAIKAGVGAKAISELAYAAKLSDIDLSSLSTALKKMQVALSQASTGGKEQNETLRALGVTLSDLKGLSPDRQFERLGDAISRLKDPADRARAATALFGKAGADLLPLFEQGAAGIRKAREEAERLGLSFSGEQLRKLADADDAIKRLKASWEGFATALTAKAAPAISTTLDLLHGVLPTNGADSRAQLDLINGQVSSVQNYIDSLKDKSGKNFKKATSDLAALRAEQRRLRALAAPGHDESSRPSPGFEATDTGDDELSKINVTAKRATYLKDYYLQINELSKTSTEKELERLHQIEDGTLQLALSGNISWQDYADRVAEINEHLLDDVQTTAEHLGDTLTKQFDKMSIYAEEAARNMQDALANFLFDPFSHGLKGMLSAFTDTIRRMIAEAAAAKIFDSFGGSKGIGKSVGGFFKGLFGFANGGSILPGGSGGTDSQVVAFRKSPSEQVDIYTPGGRGGGAVVHMHNDFRGATVDAIKYFQSIAPALVQQAITGARMAVRDDISRRAYG